MNGVTSTGWPEKSVTMTSSARRSTTWSWPSSMASRVNSMKAETSEARKFSPSPIPTTSGEFRRAATRRPGSSALTATRVNAPDSRLQAARMASARSPVSASVTSSRCATTSVSVSEAMTTPRSASSAVSSAKFSMIPLWITAMRPPEDTCGWALTSVGPPWVAHRVCPIPVVDGSIGSASSRERRFSSLPAFLRTSSPSGATTATPAESYPRYSRRLRPATTTSHGLPMTRVPHDSTHGPKGSRPVGDPRPGAPGPRPTGSPGPPPRPAPRPPSGPRRPWAPRPSPAPAARSHSGGAGPVRCPRGGTPRPRPRP